MKKINVLQLITGLGMGGAEKIVLDLSKYLSKEQFNVFVIGLSKKNKLLNEFLENKIETIVLNKSNSFKDFIDIIKILNSFVKEKNIDIIHAHMTHSVIIASFLKILNPKLKIVFTSHSYNVGSRIREFILFSLKSLRNVDIVFSEDIIKYFYKKNYKIIPNGIEIKKYNLNVVKNKTFTFIAIGRLEKVKNHKILIEIAKEMKNFYNFQIQIVGEGPLKDELQDLINKYKLKEYVKLLGLRNDIPILLNKAHCFVMPSLWEGLPISMLEAGASRLPVISTPVGSIPSLLNDNNGYLCDLKKFKYKMMEVIQNYNVAKKKGLNLYNCVKSKYSINNMVRLHENIYRNLVNEDSN